MDPLPVETVSVKIVTDNSGAYLQLPTVLTSSGVLEALVEYQLIHYQKSISWHKVLCRALRMLLEYANSTTGCFVSPRELFESFAIRIRSGTIGDNGLDPSGLYWKGLGSHSAYARQVIEILTAFSKHLVEKGYAVSAINPLRDATQPEQIVAAMAWAHKNTAAFLGHTESETKARRMFKKHAALPDGPNLIIKGEQKKRFPEDAFWDLLFNGFAMHRGISSPIQKLDFRGVLITLLLHGGGLRLCEAFHLWTRDVTDDPGDFLRATGAVPESMALADPREIRALVRIHHPQDGRYNWRNQNGEAVVGSRAEYLTTMGWRPRNIVTGTLHAGWKNPTLDGTNYLQVWWSDPAYGILFLQLWRHYLQQLRSLETPSHPWAFVNLQRNRLAPYTMDAYQQAHARAVERIGLRSVKAEGTTPHGHRHAYMQRLKSAGVDSIVIQRAAHHHSIESQAVYTEKELADVRTGIAAGFAGLKDLAKVNTPMIAKRFATVIGEPLSPP